MALHFVFRRKPYTVRSTNKKLNKYIKGLPKLPTTIKIKKYGKSKKNPGKQ